MSLVLNGAGEISGITDLSDTNSQPILGRRNLIINGAMQVAQRGNSFTGIGNGSFPVDRYRFYHSIATVDSDVALDSIAPPSGFKNFIGLKVTTAGTAGASDYCNIQTFLEGDDVQSLGFGTSDAKDTVISFWVRSSLTGNFAAVMHWGDSSKGFPFLYNIPTANTWTYITQTIPGNTVSSITTGTGRGIGIVFDLGNGSSFRTTANGTWQTGNIQGAVGAVDWSQTVGATFCLTGLQLEVGSDATPFEHRSFGEELALCERYYEKSYNYSSVPGSPTGSGVKSFTCNNHSSGVALYAPSTGFRNEKRAIPTMTVWAYGGQANQWHYGVSGLSETLHSVTLGSVSTNGFSASMTSVSSTANTMYGHYVADAEL